MDRPEWLGPKLERHVSQAVQFFHELTDVHAVGVDEAGRDIVRLPAMPLTAVAHAQALAFEHRHKAGAVVSMTRERGFVIRKLVAPDGSVSWSAPVFMRGRTYGVGITGGSLDMRICLAIMNEKGLHKAMRPQRSLGGNWAFLVDMNGSRLRRLRSSSSGTDSQVIADADGAMMAKYYLLEAGIVDISLQGGAFTLNNSLNRRVYGSDVQVDAILRGDVPPPPEFQPLYDLLDETLREVVASGAAPRAAMPPMGPDRVSVGPGGGGSGGGGNASGMVRQPSRKGLAPSSLRSASNASESQAVAAAAAAAMAAGPGGGSGAASPRGRSPLGESPP